MHRRSGWNVLRNHTTRPDHRIVRDDHAGQDDGAAADPDTPADANGAAELKSGSALRRIARMVGGVDLDGRADLRAVPNGHLNHIENNTVEIEECARPEPDIEAVITEERRADFRAGPTLPSLSRKSDGRSAGSEALYRASQSTVAASSA